MHDPMTLNSLVEQAHAMALRKGWWQDHERAPGVVGSVPPDSLAAKCMLIVTEVAEAVECVRDGELDVWYARDEDDPALPAKPEGLPIELADIVIRVADLCGALGIDLDEAVRIKLAYNATRTHRHGGRAL